MKETVNEVFPIEDLNEIRTVAQKGYNVVVNAPSYGYDVEFYYNEVYVLKDGKEVDMEGFSIETEDVNEVYDWLNDLSTKIGK